MVQPLEQLIERLERATSLDDLQREAVALRDFYRIDHIAYIWISSSGQHYGCGTYSMEWRRRYLEKEYLRIDPVILRTFQRFHPVDWRDLDWSPRAARAFRADAMEHGLGNQGLAIPIRGPSGQFALFTVNHRCDDPEWEAFIDANRRDLILVAHLFNQKALEFESEHLPESARTLSPREIDVMTALALGQSRAQAAESLGISESTLRVYVESARHKLGALNTTHAVARAVNLGLIMVEETRSKPPRGAKRGEDDPLTELGPDPGPASDSEQIH